MRSHKLRLAASLTALALVGSGCSGLAAILFDRPQGQPTPGGAGNPGLAVQLPVDTTPVDTIRPPIEGDIPRDSVLALLPRDVVGNIDWVAARREGIIDPRHPTSGDAEPDRSWFGYDFFVEDSTSEVETFFPHSEHVDQMACRTCHSRTNRSPATFATMEEIRAGESCGRCHGNVAFDVAACSRCHPSLDSMPVLRMKQAELIDDIVFTRPDSVEGFGGAGAEDIGPSRFPHWTHRIRYQCSTCHPSEFPMAVGTDTLSHREMEQRRSCGACHNRFDAFGFQECSKCHVSTEGA